jgi:SAM-dependent methyltransferase
MSKLQESGLNRAQAYFMVDLRWGEMKRRLTSGAMQSPHTSASKLSEIHYIENLTKVRGISPSEVKASLLGKPFKDARRGWYLMDLGQIMKLLPDPPARLLDLAIGAGWTSKYLALSGYNVVGLDIAESMINIAKINCEGLRNADLYVCDYESGIDFGQFDCALIYDALHHANDEVCVLRNVYNSLKEGGTLVTAEPGRGHAEFVETLEVVRDFGVTEKDMEFSLQKRLMHEAGFSEVRQYYRLSELVSKDVSSLRGRAAQNNHFGILRTITRDAGFTSIVVAIKNNSPPSHANISFTSVSQWIKEWWERRFYSTALKKALKNTKTRVTR